MEPKLNVGIYDYKPFIVTLVSEKLKYVRLTVFCNTQRNGELLETVKQSYVFHTQDLEMYGKEYFFKSVYYFLKETLGGLFESSLMLRELFSESSHHLLVYNDAVHEYLKAQKVTV